MSASDELYGLYHEVRTELEWLASGSNGAVDPFRPLRIERLDQTQRRLIVRSAFAGIEAIVFRFKQLALESQNASTLTPAERAICAEESYELGSRGQVETRSARLRLLPNLRFAFQIAAKVEQVPFVLDVSGQGWQALRAGLVVRHRLMHPKRIADLRVSDEEAEFSIQAFLWVEEQVRDWLLAENAVLTVRLDRLLEEKAALEAACDPSKMTS